MSRGNITHWWKKHGLSVIVFITGAAILIIEVTATRILSPYYGNTIYMVSAVISVILGALSIGYWRGGVLADRNPSQHIFYKIIYLGGGSIFILYLLMLSLLPFGGNFFSLKTGPLIWSFLLFFPPSYLLGMLSPFAITLAHTAEPARGLGHTTGQIFFWSTAGSIAGSLAAGFILIPYYGVESIIFVTALVVLLIGGYGYIATKKVRVKESAIFLILLIVILTYTFVSSRQFVPPNTLFVRDGVYERLTIIDMPYADKPARFFLQDRSTSGIMYLNDDSLVADYTKYYALYKKYIPDLSRALIIGGGVYSIPKALHQDLPHAQIDVAEIEPSLEEIAQKYFRLPSTPRIATHTMDGRRFLYETKNRYDMIYSDVYYSLYSIPAHFTTKEFFSVAKSKLTQNGIFIANIIGTSEQTPESLLYSEIRTMREVFPNIEVFAVNSPTSAVVQNFILVGINGTSTFDALRSTLSKEDEELFAQFSLRRFPVDLEEVNRHTILTDDFAPVEHLVSGLINTINQTPTVEKEEFSGSNALERIITIVGFGSRALGTEGHELLKNHITQTLAKRNILTLEDNWKESSMNFTNIVGRINPNAQKRIILSTHYDSITRAYKDKESPNGYMPGANNGASGVALLLEASAILNTQFATGTLGIDLVFFDGEEGLEALGEGSTAWKPIGSTHFAKNISQFYPTNPPLEAIVFDMICDKNLEIFKEQTSIKSAKNSVNRFWDTGRNISPTAFNNKIIGTIGDDHTPLALVGIPSFLVIDFDYKPWYNTTKDTPDKCSAESLGIVGNTLLRYLK